MILWITLQISHRVPLLEINRSENWIYLRSRNVYACPSQHNISRPNYAIDLIVNRNCDMLYFYVCKKFKKYQMEIWRQKNNHHKVTNVSSSRKKQHKQHQHHIHRQHFNLQILFSNLRLSTWTPFYSKVK